VTAEPAAALTAALARIAESESALHAWVEIDELQAREQARCVARDAPLRGAVVGIKDIFDVAGMPTRCGLRSEGRRAARDADAVARLRVAGAVIVGKTQTTPYAWLDPARTRNPHALDRTPGGSSAGSAAAVAAGHCSIALGSQTAASTLRPASFCGVVGYKPSFGRVPTGGVVPLAPSLDHVGVFARCVSDIVTAAVILDPSLAALRSAGAARRVVVDALDDDEIEPASRTALARAADALRACGREVKPLRLPGAVRRGGELLVTVLAYEAAAEHGATWRALGAELAPRLSELLERGAATSATAYRAALAEREALRAEIGGIFEHAGALLTPCALGEAPHHASTGDGRYVRPWTFFGLPAVAVPVGSGPHGLPVGIQIVAPLGADAELLATAELLENAIRARAR